MDNNDTDPLVKSSKERPSNDEDKHCFPYYDFIRSLFRRFDTSFLWILLLENFNFGLFMMVQLCSQDLFKAYMD